MDENNNFNIPVENQVLTDYICMINKLDSNFYDTHCLYTLSLTVILSMLAVHFYSFPLLIDTEIIYVFATSKQK